MRRNRQLFQAPKHDNFITVQLQEKPMKVLMTLPSHDQLSNP